MGKTFSRISFHLCAIFGIGGTQEQDAGTRKKYEQQDIELQIELNPREMHVKLQFSPISLGNFLGWCQVCNFWGRRNLEFGKIYILERVRSSLLNYKVQYARNWMWM